MNCQDYTKEQKQFGNFPNNSVIHDYNGESCFTVRETNGSRVSFAKGYVSGTIT